MSNDLHVGKYIKILNNEDVHKVINLLADNDVAVEVHKSSDSLFYTEQAEDLLRDELDNIEEPQLTKIIKEYVPELADNFINRDGIMDDEYMKDIISEFAMKRCILKVEEND